MMLDYISLHHALEVFAYPASLAAAVILPLAALWFMDHPTGRRLIWFLVIGRLFGAMQ